MAVKYNFILPSRQISFLRSGIAHSYALQPSVRSFHSVASETVPAEVGLTVFRPKHQDVGFLLSLCVSITWHFVESSKLGVGGGGGDWRGGFT